MTAPPPPYPPHSGPDEPPKRKSGLTIVLVVVGVLIAACGGLAALGAIVGDEKDTATKTSTSQSTTSASAVTTKGPISAPGTTTVAAALPPGDVLVIAPFPSTLDPRCKQADADTVATIRAGLKATGARIEHAVTLAGADGYEYIGASIVSADGTKFLQRSDVWVRVQGKVFAATGGARNDSTFPKATDTLDVDLGGDSVQTTDRCAYDWAKATRR